MKKIISLFLSLILTFSMTLGVFVPGVASAAPGDKTLEGTITIYDTAVTGHKKHDIGPTRDGLDVDGELNKGIIFNRMYINDDDGELRMVSRTADTRRIQFFPNSDGTKGAEAYKYEFTGFYKSTKSDASGNIDFAPDGSGKFDTIQLRPVDGTYITHHLSGLLKANVWYEYTFIVDMRPATHTFDVLIREKDASTYVIDTTSDAYEGSRTFTQNSFEIYTQMFSVTGPSYAGGGGHYDAYKDLKLTKYRTIEKADILTIDSAAVDPSVAPEQKRMTIGLSEKIEGLTPGDITVVDKKTGELNTGDDDVALEVSSDGKTVVVTMENEFREWTDCTLKINPSVYEGYTYVSGGASVIQSELEMDFKVRSTGFAMREDSISSAASKATFNMEYTNASSSCEPITLLLPIFDSEGKMIRFKANSIPDGDLPVYGSTADVTIWADYDEGNVAKMFAINGWSGKTPHYGQYWHINHTPSSLSAYSSAEPMSFGAFNYTDKKISVRVNTNTGAEKKGVLYIYDSRYALSDGASPEYVDFLTTAYDGTFEIEIPFKTDVNSASYDTTTYNVEFYYPGGSVSDTFTCYDKDDRQTQKETAIFNQAKAAATVGILKQVIEGLNINEVKVNDNFAIFDVKADLSVFESLKNKDNVYSLMFSSVSSLANYQALVDLFEAKAKVQYNNENVVITEPSSDNSSYGGFGGGMKDTSPVIPAQPGNTGVSGTSGFSDMTGHWASEFASELSKRGIMNGYPNGSFNGEGLITRAELAKTLVEAVDIALGTNSSYYDVDANAWHSPYIAGAANAGIITGFENGSFGPDLNVTRQDAALMIYRALGTKMTLPVGYTFFTDDFDISDYASDAIRCLGELKIINGTPDGRFNPLAPITRAEIAALICRSLDYIESH